LINSFNPVEKFPYMSVLSDTQQQESIAQLHDAMHSLLLLYFEVKSRFNELDDDWPCGPVPLPSHAEVEAQNERTELEEMIDGSGNE
jgi:hypothetical protein